MNTNRQQGFVQNIVIIAIVLVVAFLSQQSYIRPYGAQAFDYISAYTKTYSTKAGDWLKSTVYPKINQEAQSRGESAKNELENQKNNVAQNVWENGKNYFAEKYSKTFGAKVK